MSHKPFRVLSLDGGGMRGLYTASVLSTLANRFGGNKVLDVGKGFDLIVGTSTGGILATAVVAGVPIPKVIDLYRKRGPIIFKDPLPSNKIKKFIWAIRNSLSAANPNAPLIDALTEILQDETVGQVYKRRQIGLCLTSVNIATHKSRVFKTAHDPKKSADDKRKLTEICLASSAAPMILPIAGVSDVQVADSLSHFVDGGLWANNPVLVGFVEALLLTEKNQPIEIISVGTCPPPSGAALTGKEADRGVLGWNFGIKTLELSMDAQASGHQFIATFLASHFSSHGKPITILRLDQSSPSSEQAPHLGLDNVSEKAQSTLIQLGNSDALEIYGKAIANNPNYQVVRDIFNQMPELKEQV